MNNYAIIVGNTITNICVWDGQTPFDPGPGATLTPMHELPAGADIGWTLVSGNWTPPAAQE